MDAHSLAMSPCYPNVRIRVYTTQYLDPRRPEWLRNPFSGSSRSRDDELMKLQECCLAVVDVSSAHANFVSSAHVSFLWRSPHLISVLYR
jgi:hypothetical protein